MRRTSRPCIASGRMQSEPSFEVPRQGSQDHIGPVAHQINDGQAHGIDPIFELFNDVLLIAAPIGQTDDLLVGVIDAVGDIEKVTQIIEEIPFALLDADVLSNNNQPVWLAALLG